MGAPTETWRTHEVTCSRCGHGKREVELHHDWDPSEDTVYPPYELRFDREGWELRLTEQATRGDVTRVYVEFVCPKCVREEGKGKVVVKA